MNTDQEDELLALHSILGGEEFVRDESNRAGEIRVSAELPAGFTVALTEGKVVRQYEIEFLPPLLLTFELPEEYPSSSPPSFTLSCSWLTRTQLSALSAQLTDLYQATGGTVVLFSWVQFLKEDALTFLDIHTLLELPSDEHTTQHYRQDSQNAALAETTNNQDTLKSGSTDGQSSTSDLPAPSLEAQHPIGNPPTSDCSSTDSWADSIVNQSAMEAEQTFQTSDFKTDGQKVLSQVAGKSKPNPPFSESHQIGQEDLSNEGDVSASLLPSSSLGELDHGGQAAALPIHPSESFKKKEQTLSGLSLAPSQTLLSQLLIYNAAQKQKVFAITVFECGVCFVGWLGSECLQLPECGHIFCQTCLAKFCKLQITEGNIRVVTCPQAGCTSCPTPAQVKSLVGEELFSRYDRLLLQSTLDHMPDVVYCPRRSCGSAVIVETASTAAVCCVCSFAFCVNCRKTYHGTSDCQAKRKTKEQTENDLQQSHAELPQSQEGMQALWDDYASGSKQRKRLLRSRYGHSALQVSLEDCLSEHWMEFNCKNCPHCFCRIQKNSGCNMMKCSFCRQYFCWACLTRLPAVDASKHFVDSPCSSWLYRT